MQNISLIKARIRAKAQAAQRKFEQEIRRQVRIIELRLKNRMRR